MTQGRESSHRIASRFVLRTPLLPFSDFTQWGAKTTAASVADDAHTLPSAFDADTSRLRAGLRAVIERPDVQGALFVASPDLFASLPQWLESPDTAHGQKVERALVRYLSRMSGRATPFGLFSGVSSGWLGERTYLRLRSASLYRRHTRLDNDYLFSLTEAINRDPSVIAAVPLWVNSSLYEAAARIRYAEARLVGKTRTYHLVSVEPTAYLKAVLRRASRGATRHALAEAIVETDREITVEEALEFVDELVDSQILVTDIGPNVTGPEPIDHIIQRLEAARAAPAAVEALARARSCLASIDAKGLSAATRGYRGVTAALRDLPVPAELPRLFQVDMVKPTAHATLGPAVRREIARGIEALHRISRPQRDPSLRRFCEAFTARYDDREVPLVEALDEDAGIGFEASDSPTSAAPPLLAGLNFPRVVVQPNTPWDRGAAWLFQRLCSTLRHGERVLELTDHDIAQMSVAEREPLPDALSTTVEIAARSDDALAAGDFEVLLSMGGGPPGARLSGRFCHPCEEIHAGVRAHLRDEEALRPDAVFAEVVHLPQGRSGNVLCRPVLRHHEICYLGISGAPPDKQISISDLLVSVQQGRAVLRSQTLGREVVPRLTTAHTYRGRGLGLYRFLGALQTQGSQGFYWTWGALESAPVLPRVKFGRLVFQRARWRLDSPSLTALKQAFAGSKAAKTPAQVRALRLGVFRGVQSLRRTLQLPRHVVLADGDNELPVDLDNALSVDSFAQLVKSRASATLFERFPGAEDLVVEGPEGRYVHEINLSLVRQRHAERSPVPARASSAPQCFTLGSPWLYAKLYTGTASADEVLRRVVSPLCRRAVARGDADRWFFVRYGDPDWHLRVRLRGDPDRLLREVLPELHRATRAAMAAGMIWRVQFDGYQPELERYGGGEGIELAERIFAADSEAVSSIVDLLSGDEAKETRWRLALRGVDMLLDDFGLDLPQKRDLTRSAAGSLAQEFRVDSGFRRQLGATCRRLRAGVSGLLTVDPTHADDSARAAGLRILAHRSERVRPVVARLREREPHLSKPVSEMVWAFAHMHANRLLRSVARAQELVIHDLLRRHYESALARKRRN